ncbi:MAG: acyl carrier protein [Nitrosomonas sp.]|nr:acyl carrier protein [Nitrosomonas sp.]MBP6076369.1 acyl carrier protein [Nitrosomonas sp.]
MDHTIEIKQVLSDVLGLGERINSMTINTFLLGNIPELDSVAVVTVILALEKEFSISINDDEISAQTFQTLGTLANFVKKKVTEKDKQ